MEITELPPTRFDLPGRDPVSIATQRWVLEAWEGEDPSSLLRDLIAAVEARVKYRPPG